MGNTRAIVKINSKQEKQALQNITNKQAIVTICGQATGNCDHMWATKRKSFKYCTQITNDLSIQYTMFVTVSNIMSPANKG